MDFTPITQLPPITSITALDKQTNQVKQTQEQPETSFADIYKGMIENVRETEAVANQDALDLAMGNVDDLHTVMINAQKAEVAVNLTVAVTNKVVNAYNEIIKMNI